MKELKSLYEYLFNIKDTGFEQVLKEIKKLHGESVEELNDKLKNVVSYLPMDAEEVEVLNSNYLSYIHEVISSNKPDEVKTLVVKKTVTSEHGFYPVGGEEEYIDILIKNEKFVESPPNDTLKPWGGEHDKKDDCPEGHYNLNWEGYNEYFGTGWLDHEKIWHGPIEVDDNAWEMLNESIHEVMANVLYELTFYGYTTKVRNEFAEDMDRRLEDVKSGNVSSSYSFEDFMKEIEKETEAGREEAKEKEKNKKDETNDEQ